MIGEGLGKDAKEARKAAFHDAVSKVVGSLVDSETLVKNDEIISERILEFSGGFIKTYDVIESGKTDGDMVRIRIRAVVERLQIVTRLTDMKVTTKEIKGTDLLAEKMTKEEARKNATELLAKLYADIPKMVKAEVQGKPELTNDLKGVKLHLVVAADTKAYWNFAKKAAVVLDKIAVQKGSEFYQATSRGPQGFVVNRPSIRGVAQDLFRSHYHYDPFREAPSGYAVWLLTSIDGNGVRTRWNSYWVDADIRESLKPLDGEISLQCVFLDDKGERVTEDEIRVGQSQPWGAYQIRNHQRDPGDASWFMYDVAGWITNGGTSGSVISLYVAPLRIRVNTNPSLFFYDFLIGFEHKVGLTDKDLERVKEIKVRVELKRSMPSKP